MQQGQYDFIMNPGGGRVPVVSGGGSMKSRIILMAVLGVVIVIVAAIVLPLIFNNKPGNAKQLLEVAQQQNELIRVADIGVQKAHGTQAKNLAMTTKLGLTTDQKPLIDALKKQKIKVGTKELGASKNTKTDDMLTAAEQNNRFDEAFLDYIQDELVKYQKNLSDAYRATISKSLKETLKTQYQNASILIGVKPEE